MHDKCTRTLPPVRIPESLETSLMRLAASQDRTLSDYIKLVLTRHAFGHAPTVDAVQAEDKPYHA